MSEKRLKVYISSAEIDFGQLTEKTLSRNNLEVLIPKIGISENLDEITTSIIADITTCDVFIGIYSLSANLEQELIYHAAMAISNTKKLSFVIYFLYDAWEYRSARSHSINDNTQASTFIDEVLRDHVINPAIRMSEFTANLTTNLSKIKGDFNKSNIEGPFEYSYSTAGNRLQSVRLDSAAPSHLPPDFDERVYAASFRAIKDMLNEAPSQSISHITDHITINPMFGQPNKDAQYLSDIFVIMPFSVINNSVYVRIIQKIGRDTGKKVLRGDDFFQQKHIMSEVWSCIYNASLIIADCTGNNPNVMYELGIAHTLGKPVIAITKDSHINLGFDIQSLRTIRYEDSIEGGDILEYKLKQAIVDYFNAQNTEKK